MWRSLWDSMRVRRVSRAALATAAAVSVVGVGLGVDDSNVTRVELAETGVWLALESAGELVNVDLDAGVGVVRLAVADPEAALVVTDRPGRLAVIDRTTGQVSTIDPALGVVRGTETLETRNVSGVVSASGGVWVIGARSVAFLPDGSETAPVEVPLGGEPSSAASAGSDLVVVVDGQQLRVDANGGSEVGERVAGQAVVNVGDDVAQVVPGDDRAMVDGSTACLASASPHTSWFGSAGSSTAVVGTDARGGSVHVSTPRDGSCRTFEVAGPEARFGTPVVLDDVAYLVDESNGRVHVVDLHSGSQHSSRVFAADRHTELVVSGTNVIAHEPRSSRGVVLGPDGVVRLIDKSNGRGTVSVVADGATAGVVAVEGDADASVVGDGAGETADTSGETVDAVVVDAPVVLGSAEGLADEVDAPPAIEDEQPLVANFAFSAARVRVGESVTFVDESTGGPRSWTWTFGDGTDASGARVEKSWTSPGTYTVTLTVDSGDESASRSALIEVVSADTVIAPSADFTFSARAVATGEAVEFTDVSTGEVSGRRWDFGDGRTGSASKESVAWSEAGTYTVTLTVFNDAGSDSASVRVNVVDQLKPPRAAIEAQPRRVEAGEPVRFRSVSTGDVAELRWDFGDGFTSTRAEASHAYDEPGTYVVRLRVTNSAGASEAEVSIVVVASTLPPVARIAPLPPVIEAGSAVELRSTSINQPTRHRWEFGDGTDATGAVVAHSWSTAGTYTVTLEVANDRGTDSVSQSVTVLPRLPAPVAGFTSPSTVRVGSPLVVVDTSLNATTVVWEFGDGATSIERNASHVYSAAGSYTIRQTVGNRNGTAVATAPVQVLPALPNAVATASPLAPRAGDLVTFVNSSTNAITSTWDFGDGTPPLVGPGNTSPTHVYAAAGSYDVTLTVSNAVGEADSVVVPVTVDPPPPTIGSLSAAPMPVVTQQTVTFSVAPGVGSGPIAAYHWTLGNGVEFTTATPTLNYAYPAAGPVTATVVAEGVVAGELSAARSLSFTVADPPTPTVSISAPVPASPRSGQSVTLTAVVGSGTATNFIWSFGDGTPTQSGPTLSSVSHVWASPGTYQVVVQAVGPLGTPANTGTAQRQIVVVLPPAPSISTISASPQPGVRGQPVSFSAVTTGGPVSSWSWSFGDSATSTLANPSHTYGTAGSFTVTVTAAGPGGSDSETLTVTVVEPPPIVGSISVSPASPVVGQSVTLTAVSGGGGPATSWQWQVDGVDQAGSVNPITVTFNTSGPHTVRVRASGPGGGPSAWTTRTVTVVEPPPIVSSIATSNASPQVGESITLTAVSGGGGPATSWTWTVAGVPQTGGQGLVVSFPTAGTRTVSVVAHGPGGPSVSVSIDITVTAPGG